MKHNDLIVLSMLISTLMGLNGCASDQSIAPPSNQIISGDQMLRDSQAIAQLNSQWKKGKQLIEQGNTLVREGQTKIDEGSRLITEGEKIVHESEESYKKIKQ
ncbi:MAG: hypothetical protein K9K84_02460 [Methylovulum sp.]|jgi:hypothetical protein|nr:hypothetical protein [Methylovulum sp.]